MRIALGLLVLLVGGLGITEVTGAELPSGASPPALEFPHFPSRLHAFVWRNWGLVPSAKLADVVGATPEQIEAVAAAMGLPPGDRAGLGDDERSAIYITILRRNWHLLPYDQLLRLLDMTSDQLAFALREDDFLYVKLGSVKPKCEPLRWHEPSPDELKRANEIKLVVERAFGDEIAASAERPLAFRTQWEGRRVTPSPETSPRPAVGDGFRIASSYFGGYGDSLGATGHDGFPDGLLADLAAEGVNGIWLHVVLRQLAPGGVDFPEFGQGSEARLARLRELIARAGTHGIKVYLYFNEPRAMPLDFFTGDRESLRGVVQGDHAALCTSSDRVRRWLRDATAHVAREAPGLGGIITITASENLTSCASHHHPEGCPRCAKRTPAEIIAEVNATIAEGLRAGDPNARLIAWDWGWLDPNLAADVIARLPKGTYLQTVSEWDLPVDRGGIKTTIGEYALSAVGPGQRALARWDLARQAGLKPSAKVQLNVTWELASVPWLPVLDLAAEHLSKLGRAGVGSMMLGWSLGGYPSPQLRVARAFAENPNASPEAVLDATAADRYGPTAAPFARRAWTAFSRAFREYPYDGAVVYMAPQQMGPANLLYEQPTHYQATMVGIPYDDLDHWRGPYPASVFATQFQKVADGWLDGVSELRQAVDCAEAPFKAQAEADLRAAEAAGLHFASVANQARFVINRDLLANPTAPEPDKTQARAALLTLLNDESRLARRLFTLARQDSRLGFEATNHYFYRPIDLVEKVVNVEYLKASLANQPR